MTVSDYQFGPLLKSGQTDNLTPANRTTKDDGGLQEGIVKSKEDRQYSVLTVGQYSGDTNITVNGKTDIHTNQCVFDKSTGLMWNREQSADVFGTGAQGLLWDDSAGSNEDIFTYCDQANAANLSGYNDWRVPNIDELISLAVFEGQTTSPNNTAFPVWSITIMWSSTANEQSSGNSFVWNDNNAFEPVRSLANSTRQKVLLCRLGIEHQ